MVNEIGQPGDTIDEGQGDVFHGQRMLDFLAGHVKQALHLRSEMIAEHYSEGLGYSTIPENLFDVTGSRLPNGTFCITIDLARANEWSEKTHSDPANWLQQTIIDAYHSQVDFRTVTLTVPTPRIYDPSQRREPSLTPIEDGATLRIEAPNFQALKQSVEAMFPEIVANRAEVINM